MTAEEDRTSDLATRFGGAAVIACLFAVAMLTLRYFGNAYDSVYGFPQGEALLHKLLEHRDSFTAEEAARCPFRIVDFRDLPRQTDRFPIDHGQFPTALGALSCRLLHQRLHWLGVVDAHNLPIVLCSLGVLASVYRLAARSTGAASGFWAVMLCASHPRYVVDSFVNYKDMTVTLALLLACLLLVRALDRPRSLETLTAFAVVGLGLASKVSLSIGLVAMSIWAVAQSAARALWRSQRVAILAGFAVMVFVTWSFWPFLQAPPRIEHLRELFWRLAVHGSTSKVSGSWREQLLAAHGIRYLLIASPEPYLAAVVAGAAVVLRRRRDSNLHTARLALAVAFAFIGFFSFPGIFVTDGLRYLMPAVPCLALVGGIAVGLGAEWTRRRVHPSLHRALWLVFLGWLWLPVVSTHPFEITYFNDVSGGFAGARARGLPGASDYWAISYREIVRWLARHAEPHALLYTPFAPHLIATNDELRDDLELLRSDVNWCALGQKSVYVFYVTREDVYWQNPIFGVCEKHLVPLEAFRSQGAPVAKIFRVNTSVMCHLLANAPPRVS